MTTELKTERRGHTLVMTLSGPATRNALSPQVYAAGIETLNMAEANPEVCAVVLTGEGDHFCAGGDLQRLSHNRQHDLPTQGANLEAFHQWIEALRSFPKPILAAVEGVAAGGGVSLALACDLIVASESARFVMAYSKVALSPDGGATWHLARALGRGKALEILWLGEQQSAQQWQALGLVHRLAPAGQTLEQALTMAEQLSQVAPGVLASVKDLVNDSDRPLRAQLDAEKQHFLVNLTRPEAGQAIEQFLQGKRR
ncbi:MAG TPA: enoyl-CoA hydratase [Aquabacterium sp.]|uniref:oxepin-CoA hydrolase, alternative type n=1 Tax=Aquabacterium sp. TaxID=1872578 RepID=UPI002E3078E2|nr:enoyl-CoA hydratase [Aquabacterium sp.]HEX5357631.1 enoyl-CoA hydratase [Aquabacterium sp.]